MSDSTSRFGFVNFAETWNGRLAMLGFVIGLGTELLTGQGSCLRSAWLILHRTARTPAGVRWGFLLFSFSGPHHGSQWTEVTAVEIGTALRSEPPRWIEALSSALVIFCISLTQLHQPWGAFVAMVSGLVCLYWGLAYRRLER